LRARLPVGEENSGMDSIERAVRDRDAGMVGGGNQLRYRRGDHVQRRLRVGRGVGGEAAHQLCDRGVKVAFAARVVAGPRCRRHRLAHTGAGANSR